MGQLGLGGRQYRAMLTQVPSFEGLSSLRYPPTVSESSAAATSIGAKHSTMTLPLGTLRLLDRKERRLSPRG